MTFTKPPQVSQKAQAPAQPKAQPKAQFKAMSPRLKWPDKSTLPTMYDLPSEDPEEPGLPDEFHDYQPALLSETFRLQDYTSENLFSAGDLNLYYDPDNHGWHKRPDWFGVIGNPAGCRNDELRRSYVTWQEELSPFVVVELISPGTENEDFGRTVDVVGQAPTKWTVYEKILQIPYYIIYNRYSDTLNAFRWTDGQYQPMLIGTDRRVWMPEIEAGLGFWYGKYQRFTRAWLRWYDHSGWLLTDVEKERAEKEKERAEKEKLERKNEALQRKLEELGINIDDLL